MDVHTGFAWSIVWIRSPAIANAVVQNDDSIGGASNDTDLMHDDDGCGNIGTKLRNDALDARRGYSAVEASRSVLADHVRRGGEVSRVECRSVCEGDTFLLTT